MPQVRKRFWVELCLAVLSAVLFGLTLVRKDWIEFAFGIHPDQGEGSLEWLVAALGAVATVTFSAIAGIEWVDRREATP
jgi:hypothetical protein